MFLVSSCNFLCPISKRQVLSWERRCNWSSANRRYSDYIWVINKLIHTKVRLILELWRHSSFNIITLQSVSRTPHEWISVRRYLWLCFHALLRIVQYFVTTLSTGIYYTQKKLKHEYGHGLCTGIVSNRFVVCIYSKLRPFYVHLFNTHWKSHKFIQQK